MNLLWRQAVLGDLPRITRIANSVHVTLPEREEVLADKIKRAPQTCLVLQAGDDTVGYALCHSWALHQIPPLDSLLGQLADHADCLYVHDVVVLPEYRGRSAVASAIRIISQLAQARGIRFLTLVSVYQTTTMWERFGFRIANTDATLAAKLSSYGETAQYMICDLAVQ